MMEPESIDAIRHGLQDFRRDGLTRFINEFMVILQQEGYSFEDLINALATWADNRSLLEPVVKHLEEAARVSHETIKN